MPKRKYAWLTATWLLATLVPASADTIYSFDATPAPGNSIGATPFTINFTDTDHDGILGSTDTINNFPGITLGGVFYSTLDGIPTITNFADGSAAQWRFSNPGLNGSSDAPSQWTYSLTTATTPSAVPLPGALSLFSGGLGVLALLGWRRKAYRNG